MTRPIIPYGRQSIDEDDIRAVSDVLRGDYLTTGPAVTAFEEAFAARVGAKYAVACSNGTAALHLAAMAIGLGPGDVAVVPTMTFLATANGPHYTGADVAFADADPSTALMTPATVTAALDRAGPNVRALFVVHMNGQCCDMEAIGKIARDRGIVLIEDACHATGTRYSTSDGQWHEIGACAHSDMACFSLHPVKTLTMGEGGVVTTNDPEKYKRMCRLRSHGMVRDAALYENRDLAFAADGQANPWYYEMSEVGYNYRATDMQCALGSSQLKKLDTFIARRKEVTAAYDTHFAGRNAHFTAFSRHAYCDPALHLYVLLIDFEAIGKDRAQVMRELLGRRVGTQVHYLPVHRQPYYVRRYGEQALPGADQYYARALSIPLYPSMTGADIAHVVDSIEAVLGQG